MKNYLIFTLLLCVQSYVFAQNVEGTEAVTEEAKAELMQSEPELDFSSESPMSDIYIPTPQSRSMDHILWKKTIWRVIDLREQVNYPMYYPLVEANGQKNLFSFIFSLLREGKVSAYTYDETKEEFIDENKLTFMDVVKECQIDPSMVSTTTDANGDVKYSVSESDINSQYVYQFFLKEVWYYDAMESCMKFKIEAIAPKVYYDVIENGKIVQQNTTIAFWVPFDQLRPWLARQPVVINNMNSTASISYDDLFQKRHFVAHIFKEDNIQNRTLIQYCNTQDEVRMEQQRIESQIVNFEVDLWEH